MESKPDSWKLSCMLGDHYVDRVFRNITLTKWALPCQVYREVTERAGGRGSVRSGHPDTLRVDTQGAIKPKGLTKKVNNLSIAIGDVLNTTHTRQ